LGQIEQAEASFRQSLSIAHEIESDGGIIIAVEALRNDYYVPQGRFKAWLAFIDDQVAQARARQRDILAQTLLEKKARVMIDMGQFEAALSIFQSLMIDVEEREGAGGVFWGYLLVRSGRCETELGRYAGARQRLERALQTFEQSGALVPIARASMSLARLALVKGDRAEMREALSLARRAVAFYRQNRESRRTAEPLVICIRLHLALGEIEEALHTSSEMMACLEDDLPPFHPEAYLYTHALVLRALGREGEADAHLQRAYERVMEVAGRMDDPALRQSWLEKVRANREIVADAQARGLVKG
jgi:tetratricopeptide (TPR) repeat protein